LGEITHDHVIAALLAVIASGVIVMLYVLRCLGERIEANARECLSRDTGIIERMDDMFQTDHVHRAEFTELAHEVRTNSSRLARLEAATEK
jgi:hypothetical protein